MSAKIALAAMAILTAMMVQSCSKPEQTAPKSQPAASASQIDANSDCYLLIEHRGRFHRYSDLMNPAYRAQSDDPFVRRFETETNLADSRTDASWSNASDAFASPRGEPVQDGRTIYVQPREILWAGEGPQAD